MRRNVASFSGRTSTKSQEIVHAFVSERCANALRFYIGRGKQYSYQEFSQLIGVDWATIKGWCMGRSSPCLYKFLRCCAVLPTDFTNRILEIAGLQGAYAPEEENNSYELNKAITGCAGMMGTALEGHIEHTTKPDGDNILKSVKDALNGIIWIDDAQVVQCQISKSYSLKPCVQITVFPARGYAAQIKSKKEMIALQEGVGC